MRTKRDEHVTEVYERLVAGGAPEQCFVLAAGDRHRGRYPLRAALGDLMREGSGFISCVPGALAAYVGEDGSSVFILRRPRAPRG